ncbi:hypothetical protein O1611_g2746 [Lasiodiplodia mahajangana]|uniref:Uncharacterized protein n=1 Tax=Lasiodiplodia mahajangana TaxID=1108764 RepID=A0ACC2JU81_9PEZI|nr:hypothetical protein O1611_g2746 [Lasiodiplodia mahajangana]
MLHFVRDTFEKDSRYTDACKQYPNCASLSASIVGRANGVFLWVQLVVSELLVAMGNSWSLVQLQQRLDEIPNDLRSLFNQMLSRVDNLDRIKLARTFMLLKFRRTKLDLFATLGNTVYEQAVLDDIADNPGLEARLLDGSVGPYLSEADCKDKCNQMCRRLVGRCQGLLDIVETGSDFPDCHTVNFFHRTLSDFLKETEIKSEIRKIARDFNPRRALAHAMLARFKFVPNTGRAKPRLSLIMEGLFKLSTEDCSLFDEVRAFSRIILNIEGDWRRSWPKYTHVRNNERVYERVDLETTADVDSAVIHIALSLRSSSRLASEFIQQSSSILNDSRINCLAAAGFRAIPVMDERSMYIIKLLLERGASPNTELSTLPRYIVVGAEHGFRNAPGPTVPWPTTPWILLLLNISLNWALCKTRKANFLSLIELLLSYGADPSLYFVGYKVQGNTSEGSARTGPFYTDLMTMMNLWGLKPSKKIQPVLLGPKNLSTYFRRLIYRMRRPLEHVRPLQLDVPDETKFQVVYVLPWQALIQASITELEAVRATYGTDDHGFLYYENDLRLWNA